MNEVTLTLSGNVVSEPIAKQTKNGDAFLTFRMAVNEKRWTQDGWQEGEPQFFSVTAFRSLAANAYHSLKKGQAVIVSGRLRITQYEGKDGTMRTSAQVDAHDIGASLRFGQTTFAKCAHPTLPSNDRLADEAVSEAARLLEEGEPPSHDREEVAHERALSMAS